MESETFTLHQASRRLVDVTEFANGDISIHGECYGRSIPLMDVLQRINEWANNARSFARHGEAAVIGEVRIILQ